MTEPAGRRPGTALYVLNGYPVLSQTFVRNEVLALRHEGVPVEVLTLGRGDRATIPLSWSGPYGVMSRRPAVENAVALWWWATRRPRALGRLLRAVVVARAAEHRVLWTSLLPAAREVALAQDVVVCHTHFGWRATAPTTYLAALLGAPATMTLHAADLYMPSTLLRRVARHLRRVITVCRFNVDHVVRLGVGRDLVAVVPCGVDADVEPVPGAAVDRDVLLAVGRLVPKKGFDVLLRAYARSGAPAHARLDIIGTGPEEGRLRSLVDELGLAGRVRFLGSVPHDDVLEAVRRAHLLVLACRRTADGDSDAMPVVLREAMVRGRPVVATAVAGIPESVDESVGWLVPPEDVRALSAALTEATADHDEADARGAAGRRRVLEGATTVLAARTLVQAWRDAGIDVRSARA